MSSQEKTNFPALLIKLLKDQYGLKDTNIAIKTFTGLSDSTVSELMNNSKKTLLGSDSQIYLLYLCAGEQYENNLHTFLTKDPDGKVLYETLCNNPSIPFHKEDKDKISKLTFKPSQSICYKYYNKFKAYVTDLLNDPNNNKKNHTDVDKCISTIKKKFPSIANNYPSEYNTPQDTREKLLSLFQYFGDDICLSPTIKTLKEFEETIDEYLLEKIHGVEQCSDPLDLNTVKKIIGGIRKFVSNTVEDYINNRNEYNTLTTALNLPPTDDISEFYDESNNFQKAIHYFYMKYYESAVKYFKAATEESPDQSIMSPTDSDNFYFAQKAHCILGYWHLIGGLGVEQTIAYAIKNLNDALTPQPCSYSKTFTDYQLISALLLGNIYFYGKVTEVNRKKAFEFYKVPFADIIYRENAKSVIEAYSDDTLGINLYCKYAICLLYGYGTEPDIETAEKIFEELKERVEFEEIGGLEAFYLTNRCEYYHNICLHKLNCITSNEFCEYLINLSKKNFTFVQNALARFLFENPTDCPVVDTLKVDVASPAQDKVDFKFLKHKYTPTQLLAIKLWLNAGESSKEDADWAYYNLFINKIPSPSDDFYLEAYRLKGVVFSFINEYRHNVASSLLYNLGETYYNEANLENEVSKHYNFDSDFWSYNRKNSEQFCSLFWADEPSIGNLFTILNSFSKYCEFTVIVADTDGIYEEMKQVLTEKECERMIILTNLKEWTTYYNGNNVDDKCKLQQCCNNLKLQYTEPRWIDKNHDRMGSL